MRVWRYLAAVGLLALPVAVAAEDQDAAQRRWQAVDDWTSGGHAIVTLKQGDVVEGTFRGATPDHLRLAVARGERLLPKTDVRQVRIRRKDSSVHGLLAGAAAGAAVGVVVGYDRRTFECPAGCSIAIGTTLFTPVGAFVGWWRDHRSEHIEILYDASS